MTPDIQILSIVQIALIGILVVLGMFFLWRKIQRLEQKLEAVSGQMGHLLSPASSASPASRASLASGVPSTDGGCPFFPRTVSVPPMGEEDEAYEFDDGDDGDEEEEEGEMFGLNPEEEAIVQRMFQEGGALSTDGTSGGVSTAFMVFSPFGFNKAPSPQPSNPPVVQIEEADADADAATETESSVRLPSKTKLSKMNIEQLKEYLMRHQLSTDGTKKQLFERALETIR